LGVSALVSPVASATVASALLLAGAELALADGDGVVLGEADALGFAVWPASRLALAACPDPAEDFALAVGVAEADGEGDEEDDGDGEVLGDGLVDADGVA
jgi:hypothetical protein